MNETEKNQEQEREKIVIIFKKPGEKPEFRKIENSDEEFKRILGGEILKLDMVEAYIVYLKDSERLKSNIYVRTGTNSLGTTVRGNLLLVAKNRNSNKIVSLTRDEAVSYGVFLVQRAYDYSNQDENGKFLTKREMRLREISNLKKRKIETEKSIREREENTFERCEDSKSQSNDKNINNLPLNDKNKSKNKNEDRCSTLDSSQNNDSTPESEKKRICLDTEVVDYLKIMIYFLSEISKDIHNMM